MGVSLPFLVIEAGYEVDCHLLPLLVGQYANLLFQIRLHHRLNVAQHDPAIVLQTV